MEISWGDIFFLYGVILTLSFASAFAWYWLLCRVRGGYATSLGLLTADSIHLAVIFYWANNKKHLTAAHLGLRPGRWKPIVSGVIGVGLGILLVMMAKMFPQYAAPHFKHMTSQWLKWTLWAPFTAVGFSTIFAQPLGEELLDRGILLPFLKSKLNLSLAVLLQAAVFSILHLRWVMGNVQAIPYLFVVGCILGIVYHMSDSLYPSLVAHGTANFLSLSAMLAR